MSIYGYLWLVRVQVGVSVTIQGVDPRDCAHLEPLTRYPNMAEIMEEGSHQSSS